MQRAASLPPAVQRPGTTWPSISSRATAVRGGVADRQGLSAEMARRGSAALRDTGAPDPACRFCCAHLRAMARRALPRDRRNPEGRRAGQDLRTHPEAALQGGNGYHADRVPAEPAHRGGQASAGNRADTRGGDQHCPWRFKGSRRSMRSSQRCSAASSTMQDGPPNVRARPAAPGFSTQGSASRSAIRRRLCP
jgi:hypothetical protein